MHSKSIPIALFGATPQPVTRVGLGGEGFCGPTAAGRKPWKSSTRPWTPGIGYFDSARVYADSELYYGSVWGADPAARRKVFRPANPRCGARRALWRNLTRPSNAFRPIISTCGDPRHPHRGGPGHDRRSGRVRSKPLSQPRLPAGCVLSGHRPPRAGDSDPCSGGLAVDAVMMPVNPWKGSSTAS